MPATSGTRRSPPRATNTNGASIPRISAGMSSIAWWLDTYTTAPAGAAPSRVPRTRKPHRPNTTRSHARNHRQNVPAVGRSRSAAIHGTHIGGVTAR